MGRERKKIVRKKKREKKIRFFLFNIYYIWIIKNLESF